MPQAPTERVVLFTQDDPLVLHSGATLGPVEVAYTDVGPRDGPVVVVCHALTGDADALGWWPTVVGPGRPVDPDRFRVVCANLLGGCSGTTGPSSVDPATGRPYGLRFPGLHVRDLVAVHRALLAHLGVTTVHAGVGGSLGGMQLLQWALDHPGELERAALVCATSRLSAQNIALTAVARQSIMGDPGFAGGDYATAGTRPDQGLMVARMLAHITYLGEEGMDAKFDRTRRRPDEPAADGAAWLADDFEVEHYLRYQGESFLRRFDALTYLYLTRLMDRFDPFGEDDGAPVPTRFGLVSFDSDWRFGPHHSEHIERELRARGAQVEHVTLRSPWGHDSFLLDPPGYAEALRALLDA